MELDTDIRYLKGVGEKRAAAFGRLGINKLRDLLTYYPRDYQDRSVVKAIRDTADGETVSVACAPVTPVRTTRVRKGMDISKCRVTDGRDMMDITFFNQKYKAEAIKLGEEYLFYGRIGKNLLKTEMTNPDFSPNDGTGGRIVPQYHLTAGITGKMMTSAVRQALIAAGEDLEDTLPEDIRERNKLCHLRYAYDNIHFPESMQALETARKRLVFEELFILSCGLDLLKNRRQGRLGKKVNCSAVKEFTSGLPYELTNAQKRAVTDICRDMSSGEVMNRLVQGDVGSGKTVVAGAAAFCVAVDGGQTAMMAPTEILARQHYEFFKPLLEPYGIETVLLTGGMRAARRRETLEKIGSGEAKMVVGTHALFNEDVSYKDLALVITDEQHRVGVNQRASLAGKGHDVHLLVMSATPIPRTMALIIYGDLDITVIDELPPGRQKVDTFAVREDKRQRLNGFIRRQAEAGHQVFVVCPAVEEHEGSDLKSVEQHYRELRQALPELRISVLHGRMNSADKERIMGEFSRGEADVLLSTTVVEVGVDVPNATLMVVEDADRFGLSQLHQLRGRVGRGTAKSYCVLVSDARGENARDRLRIMCRTNDGFVISEEDLRLRGPGDFFGSRQHGLPEMKIASLSGDMRVLTAAQEEARRFMANSRELSGKYAGLMTRIRLLFEANQNIFN